MPTTELTDHYSRRFNKNFEDLRNHVFSTGGLVESQLPQAIKTITDLERIGDGAERIGFLTSRRATMGRPIGEHVIYMVQGRDVRHTAAPGATDTDYRE